jgi:carboxylesterase type B
VRVATAFGPACPQTGTEVKGLPTSENCLSINVWTPAAKQRPPSFAQELDRLRKELGAGGSASEAGRPVMVFLYGGGFVHGASSERLYPGGPALYDGARMAATQGIVVVTLNYRVGVLGFLAGAPGVTPNLGLLDQQLALRWVQRNIAAFGGDPSRVTLAGESAGAMSAGLQLLSMPSSQGLFRAVILESDPFGLPYRTLDQARLSADLLLLHVGCKLTTDTLACLQHLPLKTLLKAQDASGQGMALLQQGLGAFLPWAPVVDGRLVVRQPYEAALGGGVNEPVLLGTNGSEGTIFFAGDAPIGVLGYDALAKLMVEPSALGELALRYPPALFGDNTNQVVHVASDGLFVCPTRDVARAARAPAYLYHFTHVTSFNLWSDIKQCRSRACHGAELPFVFGSAGGKMAFTAAERHLSDAMMAAWGAFVRTGDPASTESGVAWPAFQDSSKVLWLGTSPALAPPSAAQCGFWDRSRYRARGAG